ncbi:uncharacterized protein LOC105428773 [Pogonomyrmex barbatus]|uniref:Uncharacterized protein LOC105428773 n=1 Tax=Pogonomyrmex barbatus TaxID=144034 RepID=A0A6I9X525_9HYME|nr:uncharacterized protein LOC105428773 [Pogonomyrmex barbatus]
MKRFTILIIFFIALSTGEFSQITREDSSYRKGNSWRIGYGETSQSSNVVDNKSTTTSKPTTPPITTPKPVIPEIDSTNKTTENGGDKSCSCNCPVKADHASQLVAHQKLVAAVTQFCSEVNLLIHPQKKSSYQYKSPNSVHGNVHIYT